MCTGLAVNAYHRIMAISWRHTWPEKRSNRLLIEEYLRLSALWVDLVQIPEDQYPFFDLAFYLDPTIRCPSQLLKPLEERLQQTAPYGEIPGDMQDTFPCLPMVIHNTCVWYLHWAELQTYHPELLAGLPPLFEPLIRFYERGGIFFEPTSNTWLQTISSGMNTDKRVRLAFAPMLQLDDATLDQLDAEQD